MDNAPVIELNLGDTVIIKLNTDGHQFTVKVKLVGKEKAPKQRCQFQ